MNIDEILSLSNEKMAVEYYSEENRLVRIDMEPNEVKGVEYKSDYGQALRVNYEGKFGFSSGTADIGEDKIFDSAYRIAKTGVPIDIRFDGVSKTIRDIRTDNKISELEIDDIVNINNGIFKRIDYIPDVRLSLEKTHIKKAIKNSNMVDCYVENAFLKLKISKLIIDSGKVTDITHINYTNRLEDLNKIVDKFISNYNYSQNIAKISSGRLPVIFSPNVLSSILSSFITLLNGKKMLTGVSQFSESLSKCLYDSSFNLYDDPLCKEGIYNSLVDDEGVYTSKKPLIQNGVLTSFYTDLITAAKFKLGESTGNGVRKHGFTSMPTPNTHYLRIDEGSAGINSMIENIESGIYVERLMGIGDLQKNLGEINGVVSLGYVIQNGRITGRLNNAIITLKLLELFKDITLSKETEHVYGMFCLPYILKDGIDVFV